MRCLRHESLWSRNSEFCSAQLNVPQLVSGMFLALLRLALHITHDKTNGFPVPVRRFDYNYDAILNVAFVFTRKLRWDSVICLASVTLFIPLRPMAFFHFYSTVSLCLNSTRYQKKKKTVPNVSLINASHSKVWFITDLTHRCTCVGEVGVEGPVEGKFIKNLPTPEQKPSVR